MRVAIPQYQGVVSGAYELSQTVSLHDLDFQNLSAADAGTHPFPKVSESVGWFSNNQVHAILIGTIDPDNAEALSEQGIHVFTGAGDMSPTETVNHFLHLMRASMDRHAKGHGGGCCGGHGESEGGCCGGDESADDHECCGGKGHDDGSECCGGKGHGKAEGEAHECCGKHEH